MIPSTVSLLPAWFCLVNFLRVASGACTSSEITATYDMVFFGDWSKGAFPKQYPTFRKSAQWSPLMGVVHNSRFTMWEENRVSSDPFAHFAEGTDFGSLRRAFSSPDVFTTIGSDRITQGVGTSSTQFSVNREFPKMSFAVRIDPSPDWFVGLSGLDLCQNGEWLQELTLDLYPYDAGTDQGFMFTSPDYPEPHRRPITEITSSKPSHPANSFYYPRLAHLPRIAHVTLRRAQNAQPAWMTVLRDTGMTVSEEGSREVSKSDKQRGSSKDPKGGVIPTDEVLTPLDCEVTNWGAWSPCDQTCKVGLKRRFRIVLQQPKNGGAACPDLVDLVICDQMMALLKPQKKACAKKHIAKEKKRYMKQITRNFNTKGKRKYIF
ncbi:spondin-2-like [Diadema antillarum]|uniref:spondin-2-like n=1 Tax=Diadema antillarum TaxID=105358 RepID=UPI003A8A6E13